MAELVVNEFEHGGAFADRPDASQGSMTHITLCYAGNQVKSKAIMC